MTGFVWPVALTAKITSPYGDRTAPVTGATTNHKGIDVSVPVGTSVAAAFDGVISKIGYSTGRGHYVVIDDGMGTQALYQHLSKAIGNIGDQIAAGQIIAKSGNSGISTGAHLHFEIFQNGLNVDPQAFNYSKEGSFLSGADGFIDKYWYWIIGALLLIGILK